ncbi:MAG: DUF262 domain-containing protein [Cyanobacteria bacterium SID2]|nr:DUF262 domain-containing protein [Cyanobacteria bacterium SID2]
MLVASVDSRLMTIGELFSSSNHYIVPHFQRDFSWTDTQTEELWNDITNTLDESRPDRFMGAIVVNNSQKPTLKLIDGQQRITTISLLMCALRDIAKEKEDEELSFEISSAYLGTKNLRTRKIDPKLTLNEVNNQFYTENFLDPQNLQQLKNLKKQLGRNLKRDREKSNKLMLESYLILHKKIQERISKAESLTDTLVELVECIANKLILILISVADEASSYMIFETLNNRELELSGADLLKNHIFAKSDEGFDKVQKKWSYVQQNVDKYEITKFIRHYWIAKHNRVREKDLFREISSKIRDSNGVLDFMTSLADTSELYSALKNPNSPVWSTSGANTKNDISRLILFDSTQCYPVLISAKEYLSDKLFSKILRILVVFSFRYSVICGLNPRYLENAYGDVAKFIRKEKPKSAEQVFEKLQFIYPSDKDFKDAFQKKDFQW